MKVLVPGAGGQVGRELAARGGAGADSWIALPREALDITDPASIERAIAEHEPNLVINAAAYTAVDRAESEAAQAFAVNRDGAGHLARACRRAGIPLIHISTDYVFSGAPRTGAAHREDDPVAPRSVYGRSKWEGEEAVRVELPEHAIVRVSWVFGPHGRNFVKTMLRLARAEDEMRVVDDQRGCPTAASDIAGALATLAGRIARDGGIPWGTYHYCGSPATTWYGFAEAILAAARKRECLKVRALVPIPAAEYPTAAPRPADSTLDCTRIAGTFGIRSPRWADALERTLDSLCAL